jgi:hypothetical protein
VEIAVAVAIFSIAAVSLTTAVANGLLCRSHMANRGAEFFEYVFTLHIVENSQTIFDAIRISSLTLPSGGVIQTKIVITPTDTMNLFSAKMTINGNRHKVFLANRNWQWGYPIPMHL